MRGEFSGQVGLFSYISLEDRVPSSHPLRKVRELVRAVLVDLDYEFSRIYSKDGRPSIAPEQLLSALLLQAFYGVRSERQLMEQLNYNMLFRWFVGLSPDAPIWVPETFSKNRERLQKGDIFGKFMSSLLNHPKVKPLLSDEHFSVDGTMIEAWASFKSFKPKDGLNDEDDGSNFHDQKRSNDTHVSTTDKAARLYRKSDGREAKLSYLGHALMENRNGLVVHGMVTQATGRAEREAAEVMLAHKVSETQKPATVGADKGYDASGHVENLRQMGIDAHTAQHQYVSKTGRFRKSNIRDEVASTSAYAKSQKRRKMIECIFGWGKQHGTMRKTKHKGIAAVGANFIVNLIAYNLIRLPKLMQT
jgi:transposase